MNVRKRTKTYIFIGDAAKNGETSPHVYKTKKASAFSARASRLP